MYKTIKNFRSGGEEKTIVVMGEGRKSLGWSNVNMGHSKHISRHELCIIYITVVSHHYIERKWLYHTPLEFRRLSVVYLDLTSIKSSLSWQCILDPNSKPVTRFGSDFGRNEESETQIPSVTQRKVMIKPTYVDGWCKSVIRSTEMYTEIN